MALQYSLNSDGVSYSIAQGSCSAGAITIPSTYNGLPVTKIGNAAFASFIPNDVCSKITSVFIPDSVTSIGDNAFNQCTSLTGVTIPNSLISIGQGAFSRCTSLTSINIPNSVTTIGPLAFENCSSLASITIPINLILINSLTFSGCTSLVTINVPNNVTYIGVGAFGYCANLTNVTIGSNVAYISSYVFFNCSSLINITVSESNSNYSSDADGILYNKNKTIMFLYPPKKVGSFFTIPNSVSQLGGGGPGGDVGPAVFSKCLELTTVVIPSTVTNITNTTFGDSANLTKVIFLGNAPNLGVFAPNIFSNTNNGLKVYRKKNFVTGWSSIFSGKPIFISNDNVIKSGGSGKLTTKKRN